MSIRVYELSKILGMSNKEVLAFLQDSGFDIKSHMAIVPSEALDILDEKFKDKNLAKQIFATDEDGSSSKPQVSIKKVESAQVEEIKRDKKVKKEFTEKKVVKEKPGRSEDSLTDGKIHLRSMTPGEIADVIQKPVSEVILMLLKQGIVASKNQLLDKNVIRKIADLYGLEIIEVEEKKPIEKEILGDEWVETEGEWIERIPIIVVIGHVDHGKTTLLDYIRKTRVAIKEKGGITQHLGAYEATTAHGSLVFLDTPGHEAFSMLRVRGLKAADIAVLVVAADDGVKPQTIEAINHAKSIGLPIIVALNKIDKALPNQIESAKQQLSQYDLIPEEWGGTTVCMPISAKTGEGVAELLEVIDLQAKLMELRANLSIPARGYILESKIEKGRGPVATVICQHGKLKVGDHFISGNTGGKISSIMDSYGKKVLEVFPSIPVQVAGFLELPLTGDLFKVVSHNEFKKMISRIKDIFVPIEQRKLLSKNVINLIIKTDSSSSKEALISSISKLSSDLKEQFNILYSGIGDITESDVILASETGAKIYGLHVKVHPNVHSLIQRYNIQVRNFEIIYKLLEDLEKLSEETKPIEYTLKKVGDGTVIKVFDIKNVGIIAGIRVKSGRAVKDGRVVVYKKNKKIGEGTIQALQREKKSVKEVHAGYECAVLVDKFDEWEVDNNVEFYQEVPVTGSR